jgi:hypothetical protein
MRQLVIHGHFYQPPREEPWLELVPREPTAAPWHDWNQRITAECYAPLGRARVLDAEGRIRRVINAWSHLSFDVGPTLFRWFDGHAPAVRDAIYAGDIASRRRLGFGNAVAMPYHHIILPLASRRDKQTEVRWGIRDFVKRFGREPEGMWLPETAVDEETLQVLAQEGIRFTILAPHQVVSPPPSGRPGRWRSPAGEELAVFCYDGPLAHDIAFGDLLKGADGWLERIDVAPRAADNGVTVTSMATDGETFGHHHRFGDLAVAALIDRIGHRPDLHLTNYAAILAEHPPTDEVTIISPTSWSCSHGVDRWRDDCGCRMDPYTSQAWRAPLRAGLEVVAQSVHAIFARDWPADAGDPWVARDAAGPDLAGAVHLSPHARRLLEAEEHALAMFTSCGWFFDDLARVEPRISMRHAARAIEFLPDPAQEAVRAALLSALAQARSNDPAKGDGVTIWHRDVLREADGPARLAASLAAIRDLAPDALDDVEVPTHRWRLDGDLIVTHHRRTDREYRWRTASHTPGLVAEHVRVASADGAEVEHVIHARNFPAPARAILQAIVRPMVFEATLSPDERLALANGTLDIASARDLALERAWGIVAEDGLEEADVVVHGALDLYDLDDEPVPDAMRTAAFLILEALPASLERDALAGRLGLALDAAP